MQRCFGGTRTRGRAACDIHVAVQTQNKRIHVKLYSFMYRLSQYVKLRLLPPYLERLLRKAFHGVAGIVSVSLLP